MSEEEAREMVKKVSLNWFNGKNKQKFQADMHGKGGIDFSGFSRFWSALKGDGEVKIQVVVIVVIGLMMFRRRWRLERSLLN